MRLKRLVVKGFKSFSDRKELTFPNSVTAVVGPNGSGKSNITESLRFVLGEQSMKTLRSKRGSDLIFNGGAGGMSHSNASVEIVFDNKDNFFDVGFDELIIGRNVNKNGENEYHINGSQVRLKDVIELLAKANMGPTGHHIISQGESDRILNASPEDRREMIEDGLGLKHLQYRKKESEKKIEKSKSNIERVESLCRELKPHLNYLEKQMKKYERAVEIKKELTGLYVEYVIRESAYIKHWKVVSHNKLEELKKQNTSLDTEIQSYRMDTRASEVVNRFKSEIQEVGKKLSSLRSERDVLSRQIGRLEGEREASLQISQMHEIEGNLSMKDFTDAYDKILEIIKECKESADVKVFLNALDRVESLLGDLYKTGKPLEDTKANNLETIEKEFKEAEVDMEELIKLEKQNEERYSTLQAEQSSVLEESRDAEKNVLILLEKKNKNDRDIDDVERRCEQLNRDEEDLDEEMEEGKVLMGAPLFDNLSIDVIGESAESIVKESRSDMKARRKVLERMKIRLEEIGTGFEEDTMDEYKTTKERFDFLQKELSDLSASISSLEETIRDLQKEIDNKFKTGIELINKEFERLVNILFGGGKANIKIVKIQSKKVSEDEESQRNEDRLGVDICVLLPQKKIKELEQLSGGERSLISIALLFALSQVVPPAFMILDETDAALDEANSKKYGDMIESVAKKSQLVVVTHNRETMKRAGIIYGVTMENKGSSTLLSVKFEDAVKVAK